MKNIKSFFKKEWYGLIAELIIVIAGILIALYAEGLRQERQSERDLYDAYKIVKNDLEKDLLLFDRSIDTMQKAVDKFNEFMMGNITDEEFKNCRVCALIIINDYTFMVSDRGYQYISKLPLFKPNAIHLETLLTGYVAEDSSQMENPFSKDEDLLNALIDHYYTLNTSTLKPFNEYLYHDAQSNGEYLKFNYSEYYLEFFKGPSEPFTAMDVHSPLYKNMAANSAGNLVDLGIILEELKSSGELILDGINHILEREGISSEGASP